MRSLYRTRGTDKAYCLRIGRTAVNRIIVTSARYNDDRNIREDFKRPGGRTHSECYRLSQESLAQVHFPERLTGEDPSALCCDY